jgi:predicted alpha-1,2-mannosidase
VLSRAASSRLARATAALSIGLSALLLACVPAQAPATPESLVNPFIGTQDYGNTFPGAALPFGMVQLSPDNGGQAGYDHDNTRIDGFSHTHLSGVGCGALGEVRVMPTTGAVGSDRPARFGSHYEHEVARPGYYGVDLTKYGIRAELSATTRTGWHRYTFPATGRANVLFDVGRANMPVYSSAVDITSDRTLEGSVEAGGFCGARDRHRVFFAARFDRPFARTGTWRRGQLRAGGRHSAGARGSNGAWLTFDTTANRTVGLQVGISYASLDGAHRNLAAEAGGQQTFDDATRAAAARWTAVFARAQVNGGSRDRHVAFNTALYHAFLHPNVIGDVDGAYPGPDGGVHVARGHTPMGNLSLWDTFRTQNQLLELLAPDVARDVALSVLDDARLGRRLPRWSLAGAETNIMTGDPVTPFLVENWSAGLLAGHEQEAYRALRANAFGAPAAGSPVLGRSGQPSYARKGYIASGLPCGRRRGSDCAHPASATLEYAAADGALALMARALGHRADARLLTRRARGYRTLWDRRLRLFSPRRSDGRPLAHYDPRTGAGQFHEGGAYQYRWLVPQDPSGLVGLLGGRGPAAHELDTFFAQQQLLRNPFGTARKRWVEHPYEYYGAVTYNPNNEPDLHAPYLYAWTGQPWKTATVVRAAQTLFTNGPEGLTGNDDLGTMSAWYVLSSLGLYPAMSGAGFFVLSTPQFPHARLSLGAIGSRQGGTLTIDAPHTSNDRRYIATAHIDGRPIERTWLTRASVAHGGRLAFTVSTHPTRWGTAPSAAPPSVVRTR